MTLDWGGRALATIAISYRRNDTSAISGRIYDRLREHFGESVFIDIDAIPPGTDFREKISSTISNCDALIVVIGKKWLGRSKTGGTRISEPDDFVRAELETAFAQTVTIVPVLVDRATMPKPEQLPDSLRRLSFLNAAVVDSGLDFHQHVDRLIRSLETTINQRTGEAAGRIEACNNPRPTLPTAPSTLKLFLTDRLFLQSYGRILGAIFVLLLSLPVGLYGFRSEKIWLYQHLSELQARSLAPHFTEVVLIDDQDYWSGLPQGRTPINRTYLANIVTALSRANVSLIALDFDLRLPNVSGQVHPGDLAIVPALYRDEATDLYHAIINAASAGTSIVLPKTLGEDANGDYVTGADIYQPYGLCLQVGANGRWYNPGLPSSPVPIRDQSKISCGYIALPFAKNGIPPRLTVNDGHVLDSFALSIARALSISNEDLAPDLRYTSYIPEKSRLKQGVQLSASDVLNCSSKGKSSVAVSGPHNCTAIQAALRARAVLVGGNWHKLGIGQGPLVDSHKTPAGILNGTVIHENFVESLLDDRSILAASPFALLFIQALAGLLAIWGAARFPSKLATSMVFGALLCLTILVQGLVTWPDTLLNCFVTLVSLWLYYLCWWGSAGYTAVSRRR